jgi:HlyD family secretion protein
VSRPSCPSRFCCAALVATGLLSSSCGSSDHAVAASSSPSPPSTRQTITVKRRRLERIIRSTGTVQPVSGVSIGVPDVSGAGNLVLTRIVPSGVQVKAGDVIAEFDRTRLLDAARDAEAKFDDLSHQFEQRKAQHRSDAEKRASEIQQAEADLAKARLELRKGPLLSEIDRLKSEGKLEDAKAHLVSLRTSVRSREAAEAADRKVVELQRERQRINVERSRRNADRLQLKAPLDGMIAHGVVWRREGPGHPQPGDQLWSGQTLARIFAASRMEVLVTVAEPDGAVLVSGTRAQVRLDAYPELLFTAQFESASPVASSLLDSPIRTFLARFMVEGTDPHLLPDLSAAVDVQLTASQAVLAVPRTAIRYRAKQAYALKPPPAGPPAEVPVTLGTYDDNFIEIASGLREGDRILAVADPDRQTSER